MFEHIHNVRMLKRNHPLEAGVWLDLHGVVAEEQRQHKERDKNQRPVIENQTLKERLRLGRCQVMFTPVMHRVRH